tara:strand:- start:127042 stop:127377 length:336 start_codon:yes stop_codon:yes gene_type:complete
MKLVYTHPNNILVAQARTALEFAGIDCTLRNQYAAGALGELAPIETWPELWVLRDRDYERAITVLENARQSTHEADWHCSHCSGENPGSFETCWQCGREHQLAPLNHSEQS